MMFDPTGDRVEKNHHLVDVGGGDGNTMDVRTVVTKELQPAELGEDLVEVVTVDAVDGAVGYEFVELMKVLCDFRTTRSLLAQADRSRGQYDGRRLKHQATGLSEEFRVTNSDGLTKSLADGVGGVANSVPAILEALEVIGEKARDLEVCIPLLGSKGHRGNCGGRSLATNVTVTIATAVIVALELRVIVTAPLPRASSLAINELTNGVDEARLVVVEHALPTVASRGAELAVLAFVSALKLRVIVPAPLPRAPFLAIDELADGVDQTRQVVVEHALPSMASKGAELAVLAWLSRVAAVAKVENIFPPVEDP